MTEEISAILTPRTMEFEHKDYFIPKNGTKKISEKYHFLRHFLGVFLIHEFKNDVFPHDFLSHLTSELPENWNLGQNWTNLKKNENRFSKLAFLPLFTAIFRFFCRFFFVFFGKISAISTHRTLKFRQSEYFQN